MNTYGSLLKKLIEFTNLKMYMVANEVGYDISYVSKWCNKGLLPASKTEPRLNKSLAQIFSKEIIEFNGLEAFFALFDIVPCNDNPEYIIEKMLKAAYAESVDSSSPLQAIHMHPTDILIDKHEIDSFFKELMHDICIEKNVDILCTLDILSLINCFNILESTTSSNISDNISVKICFDLKKFDQNQNVFLEQLYFFLNKFSNSFFTIYNNQNLQTENTIVIKNKIAILCSVDSSGYLETIAIIRDKNKIEQIYTRLLQKFKSNDILLSPMKTKDMITRGYRTDFYTQNEFNVLSTIGFEFLLPADVMDSIVETASERNMDDETIYCIKKLKITWDEAFEKSRINFYIFKSTIIKYAEDRKIIFTDIPWTMTSKQCLQHVDSIIEKMKNNDKIKFIVVDDENIHKSDDLHKIAVFINNKKCFLKNYDSYGTNLGPSFYNITDEYIVQCINNYFLSLDKHDNCSIYNCNNVESFVNTHRGLIQRMFQIHD